MQLPIYLDYSATTPVDPRVAEAMCACLTLDGTFGNPASRSHAYGWQAEEAVENARAEVAKLVNADPREIIWTSGATESNNLAIKGAARMYARGPEGTTGRGHIITAIHEHKAVLDPCKRLQREGFDVTFLEPGSDGIITAKAIEAAMRPDTILVSIMWANNEIGTVNEVPEIGKLCHDREVIFHTDATQWVGKMPTDVERDHIDLLSWSGHKIYGPKGVGALWVRKGLRLMPLLDGGIQEGGRRAGTENVAAIAGLGKAAELARSNMVKRLKGLTPLRDRLLKELPGKIEHVVVTGHPQNRLPGHASFCVEFIEGESMLMLLNSQGIAVSSGSACTSRALKASHVLIAMGLSHEIAQGSILFTLGIDNTNEDIDYVLETMPSIVDRLRQMSPLYAKFSKTVKGGK